MIIKNMRHLGDCIDSGVEMEFLKHNSNKLGDWCCLELGGWSLSLLCEMVKNGYVRTKPKTVDVRMYFDDVGEPCQVDLADVGERAGNISMIITIPLEE